jgi:hypothetical protein
VLQGFLCESEFDEAFPHGIDAVDAGEDQPVVAFEVLERSFEWFEGTRWTDLDKRDFEDLCAESSQF